MKFAILGRTQWLYDAAREAIRRGHQLVLVGTCPAAPEYRRREADFEALAKEHACPYFCDATINTPKYAAMARDSAADVALSVNWITLVRSDVRNVFRHGVINAHLGDLPRYRGNAVCNWAILAGETHVTLSIHQMEDDLDAGAIALQRHFPLTDDTYIGDVYAFADAAIPELMADALDRLASGTLTFRPQSADPGASLRCFPRTPEDGLLDWKRSARDLSRLVRASAEPFAGAFTFVDRQRLTIWRARAAELPYPWMGVPGQVALRNTASGEVTVLTGDGVLILSEVELAGMPRMRAADALPSVRARLVS